MAATSLAAEFGTGVVESARRIPVAADVDVVVVGGTAAGVSAAVAAAGRGASVFLVGGYPYLGEDLAGTLELSCATGPAATALERRLRADEYDLAPYSFDYERDFRFIGGWQYHNDCHDKLSTAMPPETPWDSILATNELSVACTLDGVPEIASVEVVVVENADKGRPAFKSVDHRGAITDRTRPGPLTGRVRAVFLDGSRAGETVELARDADERALDGESIRAGEPEANRYGTVRHGGNRRQVAVTYRAKIGGPVGRMRVLVTPGEGSPCQLLSRIRFRRTGTVKSDRDPTPLKVKKTFDAVLLERGVRFLTGSPVTDLLADGRGEAAGVVMANRSGRQAIRAKCLVDATRYGVLARLGKPVPGVSGKARFARIVVSGARPSNPAIAAELVAGGLPIDHIKADPSWGPFAGCAVTGRIWRCTFDLPMADGSYASFAAAEGRARHLTSVPSVFDAADQLRLVSPFGAPPERKWIWRVSDDRPLGERIGAGVAAGRAAAQAARRRPASVGVRVEAERTAPGPGEADVRESLGGLRPYDAFARRLGTVESPSRRLPVLGECDVVVVGGGTAGTPAAVAAARAGMKTLLVEYLHVLGGVSSDGRITGFYDGNRCGFTGEFEAAFDRRPEDLRAFRVAETLREFCERARVTVWYGAFGCGAYVARGAVRGVVLATPQGRGVVLARTVVDATGNADVAAAAGAKTTFIGADEFALQSAGQAPHRLGRSGCNSDFGHVNDPDAWDLWLFGVRSRAGAPDPWDVQQLADSRERRRIVADVTVEGWDVVYARRFPDTVNRSLSRQDSHGYFKDEYGTVAEVDGESRRFVNLPLRTYLPQGLTGIAVIGLGKGVARDVVPMTRMRADMMNEGYAIGLASAEAVRSAGGDYRRIDVKKVQTALVEKGNLPADVLSWTDDPELTDEQLARALATVGEGYRGSGYAFRYPKRSLPILRADFKAASTPGARQAYAVVLGLLGDPAGAELLAAMVEGRETFHRLRAGRSYCGEAYDRIGLALALGRTKAPCAGRALVAWLDRLDPARASLTDVRAVTLGLEALGDRSAAKALAAALAKPGVGGWARREPADLRPLGGYGIRTETDTCLREIFLARALLACGDCRGVGRRTLEAYARDPRGTLAEYANALIGKAKDNR